MTTLADKARAALEDGGNIPAMAYGREFARAVLAAEALADAVEAYGVARLKRRDLPWAGGINTHTIAAADDAIINAREDMNAALTAIRKAMEGEQ